MSGICGFVKLNKGESKLNESYLETMNEQLIPSGPDGGGQWIDSKYQAGLAYRRLAIINLSDEAMQPMTNEDGKIALVYNGEIYNYDEIRKELENIGGHVWKTSYSDTEVIIHAYEEWGIECLNKFRGIFAIALWDGYKEKMYLIRDRIGVKPIYYMVHNGILTFASGIKPLLAVSDGKPKINEKAMYDYLSFLSTPGEDTLFDGIKKLRPATYMCIEKGNIGFTHYWDIWDHTRPELYTASESEIKSQILSELTTAVQLRKKADVPVGVLLSGGIDSSTNLALFSQGEKNKVKTFSIGYDQDYESYKNETHYARKMAEFCGSEHYEQLINQEDMFSFLPEMIRLQDEPIADPVCIPIYYVTKLARENGVVVAQVGEGSDELFWGYEGWKTYLHLAKLNDKPVPNFLKKAGLGILNLAGHSNRSYYELLRRGVNHQPIFWSGAEAFYETEKKKMISESLRQKLGGYTSFEAIRPEWENFQNKAWEKSHLNWMTYVDFMHRLPELLLMRVDKMSIGSGVECRVPFLDHKFVELAMSIPESMKTKNDVSKYILKETVRGVIPDELIDRKKQGFGVPVYDWFKGRLGEEMRREVNFFAKESGLLDQTYVDAMFDNKENGHHLWYLFNLALWWKEFIYNG